MLKKISYTEYSGDPRHWHLAPCDFIDKNLVVGKNATGKSRLLSVINNICALLAGKRVQLFESGRYDLELELGSKSYQLQLVMKNSKVVSEKLSVDGEVRLNRDGSGKGKIWYEHQKIFLDFALPDNALALQLRRDELQHPFVSAVSSWAQNCKYYQFGSSVERTSLTTIQMLNLAQGQTAGLQGDGTQIVGLAYIDAFGKFGDKLDKAIVKGMAKLGYPISDVGVGMLNEISPHVRAPDGVLSLFVVEKDREAKLSQIDMSQGMYRALALVININVAVFSKYKGLLLVDDIGEGLDYERSSGLIDLVFKSALKGVQIIVTSNDRFVMNKVPLENWCLLRRTGHTVTGYTQRNSPEEYENFKFIGLSNFDFFSSEVFE